MIRLICIDVDGTLVGTSGVPHPDTWSAAARLRDAGVRLAICSGRPAFGATHEYAIGLDPDGWHVFQNGASVLNVATGESRSAPLSPESVVMLRRRAAVTGRTLELYSDMDYAIDNVSALADRHAGLLRIPFAPKTVDELEGRIIRGQWVVALRDGPSVAAEPHPGLEVNPSTSPVMPDVQFVNLTRLGVDKATAVRTVATTYGIPLDEVMFVGDGYNDAAAMAIVGLPVAMGNAEPEARAVARLHVGDVDAGGLLEALDHALAAVVAS